MRHILVLILFTPLVASQAASEIPPPHRRIQVLYIEGAPRWEFRAHRAILEHFADKKSFPYRYLLSEGDPRLSTIDTRCLSEFPNTDEIGHSDLVILGDFDLAQIRGAERSFKHLASFVTDQGGGLIVIAGQQHSPHIFKGTSIEALLPIELGQKPMRREDYTQGYRLRPTALGFKHPAFQIGKDRTATTALWATMPEMYWWASGYKARPQSEVLATHPDVGPESERHPLMVVAKAGKGHVLFIGFDETWRWRRNECEEMHQAFWVNLWRSTAAE